MDETSREGLVEPNPVMDLMAYLDYIKTFHGSFDPFDSPNPDAIAHQILQVKHLIQKVVKHCDLSDIDECRFKGPSFSMHEFLKAVEAVKDYYEKRFTGPPYHTQIMADKLRVVHDALNAVIRDYTKGIRVQDEA